MLADGKDKRPTLVNASSPIPEAIEGNFLIETRSLPLSLAVTLTVPRLRDRSSQSLHSSFVHANFSIGQRSGGAS